jgi:hypothetical protein
MARGGLRLSELVVRREGDSEAAAESRFEERAGKVIKALKGILSDDPRLTVSVLVIAKADKARKKLLYSRQFTAQRLIDAAREWQDAARNVPPTFIRVFDADGKVRWREPPTPFPDEVVRLINTSWQCDGDKPRATSNARIGLALSLLLETGPTLTEAAREALRSLAVNVTPLVLGMARAHSAGRVFEGGGKVPTLVPTVLGLALAKAGQRKGDYMSSNAYLIGRLLSVADEFHREYCKHERRGNYPPQFIGNALMPTALDNPVAGLARLADRLLLYQRVADEELRALMGGIERGIDRSLLRTSCTDVEKAEMLLGYLARPELKEQAPGVPGTAEENPEETRP